MTADGFTTTRASLQRVAVHVLARCRQARSGRFGLRATPGGFGTPSFGPPDTPEVLRVAGAHLVHEQGGDARTMPIDGSSLAELAAFAGADLDAELSVGPDTPPLGAADQPLAVDPLAAAELAGWLDLGWRCLDAAAASADRPSAVQLWPEHFDAGCSVAVGPGPDDRVNLGASPGDGFSAEPYLYVGPWGDARPGADGYWNAPFGAFVPWSAVDSVATGLAFLCAGVDRLRLKS